MATKDEGDAAGFLLVGSHYKGTCEIWRCRACGERLHVGRLQAPDDLLIAHAARHDQTNDESKR